VINGTGGETQFLSLVYHGVNDSRVAMALVHSSIRGYEVHVLFALYVKKMDALATASH